MSKIDEIKAFWDAHPLWTGDPQSVGEPGSREFFDSHTRGVLRESGGRMDPRFYPVCEPDAPILDLGCGIGFWLEQFGRRGFTNLTGADLSERSLDFARRRCELLGIRASFSIQNAQAMSWPTKPLRMSSAPAWCIIHPIRGRRSRRCIACCGLADARWWRCITRISRCATGAGCGRLAAWRCASGSRRRGRGRDDMMAVGDAGELVRRYDGIDNPWGEAFSTRQFLELFGSDWSSVEPFGYAFPARLLPFPLPRPAFRALEYACPFLIAAVAIKRGTR